MRPSPAPAVQAMREQFAARLRALRVGAGLTGRDLANLTGMHPTKISKIEHVVLMPTADNVRVWAEVCDALDDLPDLLAALDNVEGMYVEWRLAFRSGGMPRHQEAYQDIEASTHTFLIYTPGVVPGLLQTEAYAQERITCFARANGLPSEDVPASVAARMNRRRVLTGGARFAFVLEQAALRSRVGTIETMVEQLAHLVTITKRHNVSFGIIPEDIDRAMGSSPGFWVFDSARVLIEIPSAELTITQPAEIAVYERCFRTLAGMAVTGVDARDLLASEITRLAGRT
jgi:transcriptional regulator with XRE-family HTH domain